MIVVLIIICCVVIRKRKINTSHSDRHRNLWHNVVSTVKKTFKSRRNNTSNIYERNEERNAAVLPSEPEYTYISNNIIPSDDQNDNTIVTTTNVCYRPTLRATAPTSNINRREEPQYLTIIEKQDIPEYADPIYESHSPVYVDPSNERHTAIYADPIYDTINRKDEVDNDYI